MTCRPNGVRSRWATFASGTPISVCSSTTSATTAGPSCTPAAPSASRSAARGGPAPAADTASSGRPRCRSAARPGAPRAVLPDTATPRGSLRPRRRSPDTPPEPAPRGSRRPAPGAGGSRGGHTARRPAGRDAPRVLAAGPWQTARPAGDPPGVPRPTAVSGARPVASGAHSPVAGGSFLRCCLFASRSRPINFPWSRSRSVCSSAIRCGGAFRAAVVTPPLCHNSQNCTSQIIDTSARDPLTKDPWPW